MQRPMTRALTARNVGFALLGAAVLMLNGAYTGPFAEIVHSYAGNIAVSFALYFAALSATHSGDRPRLWASGAVLAAVTAFELTDGFGLMANVWDPVDLVANAAGVGLALALDAATARWFGGRRGDDADGEDTASPTAGPIVPV